MLDATNLADLSLDEQVHREVYIAILNSALRAVGSKARLAARLDISPAYLSYLLHPDPGTSDSSRRPSLRIAEAIARALPLEPDVRDALLEHMHLVHVGRIQQRHMLAETLTEQGVTTQLAALRALHSEATFADPTYGRRAQYRAVLAASRDLLCALTISRHPLAAVELCLLVHDAQCVLNRPDDALFHAKRARAVLDLFGPDVRPSQREQAEAFVVQVFRAESVAYHNLRLGRAAYQASLKAEHADGDHNAPGGQLPHILGDRIAALTDQPRFTLSEVEGLADRAVALCERRAQGLDALWAILIRRSQAQAYITYGNLKRAGYLLTSLRDQLATIPDFGPLHRVMFLKTDALYWRERGDLAACEQLVREALIIGEAAGLDHQLMQLRQQFRLPESAGAVE